MLLKAESIGTPAPATATASGAGAATSLPLLAGKSAGPETLAKLLMAGGYVMIPLLIISVITLAMILLYLVTLRRGAVVGTRYMTTADTLLGKGDLMGALAIAIRSPELSPARWNFWPAIPGRPMSRFGRSPRRKGVARPPC